MPELPEVETVVNDLKAHNVEGQRITAVRIFWPRSVHSLPHRSINATLIGRTIKKVWRRGKYIVFDLEPDTRFLIHLRMSGRIRGSLPSPRRDRHEHVCITLKNDTEIRLHDTRKFARVYIGEKAKGPLEKLGREPLAGTFEAADLLAIVRSRSRAIKPLLLDQSLIAGLGNIYTDEALWRAKVHPAKKSTALSTREAAALCRAIKAVLRKGIKYCGTSLGDGDNNFFSLGERRGRNGDRLTVYQRNGQPCLRCGHMIARIIVAQRGTHFCPQCQR